MQVEKFLGKGLMSSLSYGDTKRAVVEIMGTHPEPMTMSTIHEALEIKHNGKTPDAELMGKYMLFLQQDGFVMPVDKSSFALTP